LRTRECRVAAYYYCIDYFDASLDFCRLSAIAAVYLLPPRLLAYIFTLIFRRRLMIALFTPRIFFFF